MHAGLTKFDFLAQFFIVLKFQIKKLFKKMYSFRNLYGF